jgi:multiple sugar transport system substrate-binding protein
MKVRVALIRGGMYDSLYNRLPEFTLQTGIEVDIGFQGDHPTLNAHLASFSSDEIPYDLVSTHTKYAPSQTSFLAPLNDLISQADMADFAPLVLNLAIIEGRLFSLPRNIDVRLLHYRTDLLPHLPQTWDELLHLAGQVGRVPNLYGFLFPGMESGLFGTFFELAEMGGAKLFPENLVPDIENQGGQWALNFLKTCYTERLVPPEITGWHYDKVHDFFRDGYAAMVGDWPGYYGDYRDTAVSRVHGCFAVAGYPDGPLGFSRVYGGSHTFALTRGGAGKPEALALLRFLTAPEQQILEAQAGSVPVRISVMQQVQAEAGQGEKARWEVLETVIGSDVIIPPKFSRYPEVEEILWKTVQEAMTGYLGIDAALREMTRQIRAIVAEPDER